MEQMLKRIPVKVVNIPWRNNNLSTLHVDPPLSEQGETFIGIYLLALGRAAIIISVSDRGATLQWAHPGHDAASILMILLQKNPRVKRGDAGLYMMSHFYRYCYRPPPQQPGDGGVLCLQGGSPGSATLW